MTTHIEHSDLPAVVRAFLAAHAERDADAALATLTPDAVIVDQDERFVGADRQRGFVEKAGSEFTYTTELLGARSVDERTWVVTHRLDGDFPGNRADLDYRFTLDGDVIRELVIGG